MTTMLGLHQVPWHWFQGVDNEPSHKTAGAAKQNIPKPSPRTDSYRLSMANLESSQDGELDAILGELCALESTINTEMPRGHARSVSGVTDGLRLSKSATGVTLEGSGAVQQLSCHYSSTGTKFETQADMLERDEGGRVQKQEFGLRTDSPDNDSAFSDNVSMLSSESSASSGGGAIRSDASSQNMYGQSGHGPQITVSSQDAQDIMKSEKIKLAMEKIQESNIKKLFIKAYTDDGRAKSLLVDERMTVAHVCRLLSEKSHTKMDPQWVVVERNYDLHLDRVFEDHENLVENILMWTQDATHKLFFLKEEDKNDVFVNPEGYLLGCTSSQKGAELDDEGKATLIEEFFSATRISVPEIEGNLYLKSDGKKAWKKYFFILRASGLYYNPKGKTRLSKDLVCLTNFDVNHVYKGFNWRKKYKAPTDFGFAIKHPEIQIKSCRSIKFLCAEDPLSLKLWVTGIRIVKFGHQLKENYDNIMRDIDEEDLDTLAHARSFSVSSMAKTSSTASSGMEPTDQQDPLTIVQKVISHSSVRKNAEFRRSLGSNLVSSRVLFEHGQPRSSFIRRDSIKSSSSSSGCSSVSTPTNDQIVFEADFPVGTIKRKPSMAPKIPLTSTTRIIAKQSMTEDFRNSIVSLDTVQESNTTVSANTLGRNTMARMSLRRSHPEDEITLSKLSVDSGTLTKHIEKLQAVTYGAVDSCTETLVNNISDDDELPPPPPEAFNSGGSTLSLDSLPPPPSSLHDQVSWPSTSSLNSLPPPPTEITQRLEDGKSLEVGSYLTCQDELKCPQNAPAVPPKPVYCKEYRSLEAENLVFCLHQDESSVTPLLSQKVEIPVGSCCGTQQQSIECPKSPDHGSLKRRVSFSYTPTDRKLVVASSSSQSQLLNQDIISPNQINNTYQKPEPPRRSETTRLSGRFPATRRSSFSVMSCCGQNDQQRNVTTPHHFLRDLQRVMEKKWKVAQQLSADLTATPHQIMGFRDPCFLPPEFSSTLSHTPLHPPDSCHTDPCPKHRHHHLQQYPDGHQKQNVLAKKKLPPPPPKRSETTHLTRRQ